jgi:asparagine synthase (glutamine-hydrolysing)
MTPHKSEISISCLALTEDAAVKCQLGLLHTDGRPATPDDLAMLLAQFEDRPADMGGEIVDGPLIMAFRGDRITVEEDSEIQPLKQWPRVITWDGRLDNRDELISRLGLNNCDDIPDPAIVLKSYEVFGQSVFKDLIGEFALTLWSKTTKTLRFVRSTCGARPLFYAVVKGTLFWSSDFAHLVRVSGCDLEVNESYFLEYIITQPSTNLTPLTKVNAVPANTVLRVEGSRVEQVEKLWNGAEVAPLNYPDDRQYEEHFRDVLTQAVRVRMRANSPIFAELSGGLDSSSIVLTADQVLKSKNLPNAQVQTLSCVYGQSHTADERRFIRMVEEHRGVKTLLVEEEAQRFTLGLENPEFTGLPNPNHCSPGRYETFTALMKVLKGRVLLTGLGGDHLFWSCPEGSPLVADELRSGHFRAAHHQCQIWSRAARIPYRKLLFSRAVPLAVGSAFHVLDSPTWLGRDMKRLASKNKRDLLGDQPENVTPSQRAKLFAVDLLFRTVGCGYFNDYDDLYVSHPYTHRPLIEFCLGSPLSQFVRAGETRSLMRRALVNVLPPRICRRKSKAGADEAYIRALQGEWSAHSNVSRWRVCERGFVDARKLSVSLVAMNVGIHHQSGYLMRLVSMEQWLRSLERVPRVGTSQPKEYDHGSHELLDAV